MKEGTRRPPGTPLRDAELERKVKPKKPPLSPEIQNKIGRQLRAMYSDVVNEGVPDRFAELIRRLDEQDKK